MAEILAVRAAATKAKATAPDQPRPVPLSAPGRRRALQLAAQRASGRRRQRHRGIVVYVQAAERSGSATPDPASVRKSHRHNSCLNFEALTVFEERCRSPTHDRSLRADRSSVPLIKGEVADTCRPDLHLEWWGAAGLVSRLAVSVDEVDIVDCAVVENRRASLSAVAFRLRFLSSRRGSVRLAPVPGSMQWTGS